MDGGGCFENSIVVRSEQGVKVAGWDPNEFRGVGGTVGCRWAQARVAKRDRTVHCKQPTIVVSDT